MPPVITTSSNRGVMYIICCKPEINASASFDLLFWFTQFHKYLILANVASVYQIATNVTHVPFKCNCLYHCTGIGTSSGMYYPVRIMQLKRIVGQWGTL